jgi:DnaJ-class molecular chaperone
MAAPEQDPYRILGVTQSSSDDEIKTAYRNLAKKLHPDLNPGNKQAEKKFKDINSAYELIGTSEARAQNSRQDPFYSETHSGAGSRYSSGMDFDSDLFETLFRQARGRRAQGESYNPEPDAELVYDLSISPRDAILGTRVEFTLPIGKTLSVKIPAGIAAGAKLRFPKQVGNQDVFVRIQIQDEQGFRVEGTNLFHELSVDVLDAILGSQVRAPTAEGSILLQLPKHVDTGAKVRVHDKGLFEKTGGKRGDLIYIIQLKLPKTVSPELENAARLQKEESRKQAS